MLDRVGHVLLQDKSAAQFPQAFVGSIAGTNQVRNSSRLLSVLPLLADASSFQPGKRRR